MERGAVAVVAELLLAGAGALGPGFGAVVRVGAAGLCGRVLQPALAIGRASLGDGVLLAGGSLVVADVRAVWWWLAAAR